MDHRIPRVGSAIAVLLVLAAAVTFVFLNARFEGPDPTRSLHRPFELTARFSDSRGMATKQPVLHRGIQVGRVEAVDWDARNRQAVVRFELETRLPVRADAVARIGDLSLLGDRFLDLVELGSASAPLLRSGGEIERTRATVNFDEALGFLDARGRRHVQSLVDTIADGIARDASEGRLSGTLDGLAQTVLHLDELTRSLRGQEPALARFVSSASTLVAETGRRERAVRGIVADGRSTLDALAAETTSVNQALEELPRLLRIGSRTLEKSRPLLASASPVIDRLRALAPDLRRGLAGDSRASLEQIADDFGAIIDGLPALRRQAVPMLGRVRRLNPKLLRLVQSAVPAVRNLVPALDYVAPRAGDIGVLYAQAAAMLKRSDSNGRHIPVAGLNIDPAEQLDVQLKANCDPATQNQSPNQGYCNNAYPKPGDARNPQPFSGRYPRLLPCTPPPRSKPREPCK